MITTIQTTQTGQVQWPEQKHYEVLKQITDKFDAWLTNVVLPAPSSKLFGNLAFLVVHYHGSKSWNPSELFAFAKGDQMTSKYLHTFEQFTQDLDRMFNTTSKPLVAGYGMRRRVLKSGAVRYRFVWEKKHQRLRYAFNDHGGKHMRLAKERLTNGLPLGDFVFP